MHPLITRMHRSVGVRSGNGAPEELQLEHWHFGPLVVWGVRQLFWQYLTLTALGFEHGGERLLYVPEPGPEDPGPGALRTVQLARVGVVPTTDLSAPVRDFTPVLREVLRRAGQDTQQELALFDLLATFRGIGSSSLQPAQVFTSEASASALVSANLRVEEWSPWLSGGSDRGLISRYDALDGTSGGYRSSLALGALLPTGSEALYSRREIWVDHEEGIELT